jgi:hypothetical protein
MQKHLAIAFLLVAAIPSSVLGIGPTVYNVPPDPLPTSLLPGDTLNYDPGVILYDDLIAPAGTTVNLFSGAVEFPGYVEGTLNLQGGSVSTLFTRDANVTLGPNSRVGGATLNRTKLDILGGEVVVQLSAVDSVINLSDGRVGVLEGISGTTINMTGGTIGTAFGPVTGHGVLNVMGGTLGFFHIDGGVRLNMSGGAMEIFPWPSAFVARPGSSVHLIVNSASIDGSAIPGLSPGGTVELDVTNRLGNLTGVLSDGSPFQFHLAAGQSNTALNGPMIITAPSPEVGQIKVLITQVPEPSAIGLAAVALTPILRRRRQM